MTILNISDPMGSVRAQREPNSRGVIAERKVLSVLTGRKPRRDIHLMYVGTFTTNSWNVRATLTKGASPGISPEAKVSQGASVDSTAYVGPKARVGPQCRVSGSAYVNGHVAGNAFVRDAACVDEGAFVGESALIQGEARILKGASVSGNANVFDRATIGENVIVKGSPRIGGWAQIHGSVYIDGDVVVAGDAKIAISDTYRNLELHVGTFYGDCLIENYWDLLQVAHDGIHWSFYRTSEEGEYAVSCQMDYYLLDGFGTNENPWGGPNYNVMPDFVEKTFEEWKEWHKWKTEYEAMKEERVAAMRENYAKFTQERMEAEKAESEDPVIEDLEADRVAILRGIAVEEGIDLEEVD